MLTELMASSRFGGNRRKLQVENLIVAGGQMRPQGDRLGRYWRSQRDGCKQQGWGGGVPGFFLHHQQYWPSGPNLCRTHLQSNPQWLLADLGILRNFPDCPDSPLTLLSLWSLCCSHSTDLFSILSIVHLAERLTVVAMEGGGVGGRKLMRETIC